MIISKLYSNTKSASKTSSLNTSTSAAAGADKRNSIGDPRVITPSSIPIFILPPTLDSYANGNKPDLNDSYDCWSLQGGDDNMNNIAYNQKTDTNKQQIMNNNQVASKPAQAQTTTTTTTTTKKKSTQKDTAAKKQQQQQQQQAQNSPSSHRAASSLENLNKLDICPKTSSGVRNASISSTASTPNPHSDYYQNYTELQRKQQQQQQQQQQQSSEKCSKSRVKTLFRNGFLNLQTVNNENDEIKSKENYCNMWLLNHQTTNNNNSNSGAANNTNNSMLNNNKDQIIISSSSDGAKRSRSNANLNNAAAAATATNRSSSTNLSIASKSPSVNFDRNAAVVSGNAGGEKTEEQMQREYLVNLLLQLQQEQQQTGNDENDDRKESSKNEKANKKSKRSKSETLATLNAIWAKNGGPIGMATSTAAMMTAGMTTTSTQQHRRSSSSKRSKSNSSQNRLNSIEKQNSGKSKTNRFLDVGGVDYNNGGGGGGNVTEQRRFSLRNFFSFKPFAGSSSAKSSQSHLNKRNSEPENYLLQLLHQENQKQQQLEHQNLLMNILASSQNNDNNNSSSNKPPPPKIVNHSVSNSSSVTSNSIMPPVNSITGSVLKFNKAKLNDKLDGCSDAPRTLSDTNVNRIRADNSLRLPNDIDFSHRLSLLDRRELYKCSKSSSSTNQLDDDDNMDKIFNQYMERSATTGGVKLSTGSMDRNAYFQHQSPSSSNEFDSSNKHERLPRRFFSFMFKSSKSSHQQQQQQQQQANGNNSRRQSSQRSKFKFFSRRSKTKRASSNNAGQDQFEMITSAAALAKKNSLNSNFKFDLHNLNLNDIEKDFLKFSNSNASGANRGKSASMVSNHSIYLDANLIVPNRIKKSRSTLPDLKSEYASAAAGFLFRNSSNKAVLNAIVDVSIEKLQQSLNGGHLLSISLKNFRTEPLIEINHIKAKFNYLSIELVESKSMDLIEKHKHTSNGQLLAKINKIKSKKCKFDNNLKSFSKPVDFDLVDEHFLAVTEEATHLQMKKINAAVRQQQQSSELNDDDSGFSSQKNKKSTSFETTTVTIAEPKRTYLFLFSIEVHSYLPISRKILISTFRKKKRIFKGQCQIHENFIHSTQFTKQFLLTEV